MVRVMSVAFLLGGCVFSADAHGTDPGADSAPPPADAAEGDSATTPDSAPPPDDGSPPPIDAPAPPVDAPPPPPDSSTCDTAGLDCPGGATSMFMCGTHCWVGCDHSFTHAEAVSSCTGWGGILAKFDDPTEQTCVRSAFVPAGAMHIGLEQGASSLLDGNWTWPDGSSPYDGWAGGQPNDGDGVEDGTEQCAYLSTSGSWQDTGCGSSSSGFACRR